MFIVAERTVNTGNDWDLYSSSIEIDGIEITPYIFTALPRRGSLLPDDLMKWREKKLTTTSCQMG
jgi:hypothetical protein